MDQAAERKRQVFSIPNIMSMFRIALIPLFASALLRGRTAAAAALIALSALTDVADGFIARRFHMVTQLGKVLDPVADKLTLLVLAVFYGIYFAKALLQKRRGIQTRQIGRRKEKSIHTVELLMSIATLGVVAAQLLSIVLDWSCLPAGARFERRYEILLPEV